MEKEGEPRTLKEIEELSREPKPKYIEAYAKISDDKKSLLVRIPAKIRQDFKIKKGDFMYFYAEIKAGKVGELIIKIVRK